MAILEKFLMFWGVKCWQCPAHGGENQHLESSPVPMEDALIKCITSICSARQLLALPFSPNEVSCCRKAIEAQIPFYKTSRTPLLQITPLSIAKQTLEKY